MFISKAADSNLMKPPVASQKVDMAAETSDSIAKDNSLTRYKYKVFLIVGVTLIVSSAITVLVYIAVVKSWSHPQHYMPTTVIRVIAQDSEEKQNVDLEYKVDRKQKTAYVTSRDINGQLLDGFKDLSKGVEAFRKTDENVCFIAKMISDNNGSENGNWDDGDDGDDDDEREDLDAKPQVVAVNESRMFVVLNQTIYPTVLRLAAGEEVHRFCANLRAVWMLPEEEVASDIPQTENVTKRLPVRQKRFLWKWRYGGGYHGGNNCYYSCYGYWWRKCFRKCYYYW